jgi:pimeloyl-ACP methyl ester carboxylesterase
MSRRWRAGRYSLARFEADLSSHLTDPGRGERDPIVPYPVPILSDIAAAIRNADVVGYSYGGAVADQIAVDHCTRVNQLALLATACSVGAVPGHPLDVTRSLLPPNRVTRWPRADPLGLFGQIAAVSTWSRIPALDCIDAPTTPPPPPSLWCAATTMGPSRRLTVGYLGRASATPASSRARPEIICKSPSRPKL